MNYLAPHLPVLQVVLPLAAAPVCIILRGRRLSYYIALLAGFATLLVSALLLAAVQQQGTISYALGSWPPPWGIEYRIDVFSSFVLLLVSAIGALVLVYAPPSLNAEVRPDLHFLFYAAYLLCLSGLLGIAATGDVFNLFVFLEISSLASYALISLGRDRRALASSFQYLVMGTTGATFFVIGIGLLYMMTGTLNMADLSARLPLVSDTRTVVVAFAFIAVGMGLKLAMFPLHAWLPNAYAQAPSVVTAFLAATATKVSIYAFLRMIFSVFGTEFSFAEHHLNIILAALALLGIFVASTVAIFEVNVKRMFAYSSIAQVGYIMLGVSLLSLDGLTAGIVHLFNHALMKGAVFLALGCILFRLGSTEIGNLQGIGRSLPWTFGALVLAGLGIVGIPGTAGFVSKWYLVLAALERGWWPVAVAVLLGSLLAVIYLWRLVEIAYFAAPGESAKPDDGMREAPLRMQLPVWVLILATFYFGLSTDLTIGLSRRAAELLLGGAY